MAITSWLSQWRGVPVEPSAPVQTTEGTRFDVKSKKRLGTNGTREAMFLEALGRLPPLRCMPSGRNPTTDSYNSAQGE